MQVLLIVPQSCLDHKSETLSNERQSCRLPDRKAGDTPPQHNGAPAVRERHSGAHTLIRIFRLARHRALRHIALSARRLRPNNRRSSPRMPPLRFRPLPLP